MSEDEAKRLQQDEQGDEVEAHSKRAAMDEAPVEGEGDDDFEAHRKLHAAPKKA